VSGRIVKTYQKITRNVDKILLNYASFYPANEAKFIIQGSPKIRSNYCVNLMNVSYSFRI